ncbi:MAG: photosynthetic reaction center cytochrome c subunit [Armatimonadetes bacterium]|nr:photosynthetic reaction center cytochrome c subunit [Armatimonadota bacterium]
MLHRVWQFALPVFALAPFVAAVGQDAPAQAQTSDQVFKDIKSFKGVPAKDLIPAMEFMAASLKVECSFCHKPDDFSAPTQMKDTAREMIALQRDINTRHFNGRLEITCMSCHNGREHPLGTPIPEGMSMRHQRFTTTMKPEDLFKKHIAAMGDADTVTRKGTMDAPTGDHKNTTSDVTMIQAKGGKFVVESKADKFGSDGTMVWRGTYPMNDEPAAIFARMGRAWRGEDAFAGLDRLTISGKDKVGKTNVIVVRGVRTATGSTEELYFDEKSGMLVRFTSITRSTLGAVPTIYDYSDFKTVKGAKVPMKVFITFAGDEHWSMTFKSASVGDAVDPKVFKPGG